MSALTQMLETWEARSRGANPCDAMLINKHIREVRELLAANAVSEPVGINGLTEAETSANMSVMGLSKPQAQGESCLPERDTSKPAEAQGLFRKFDVTRADGSSTPGGKHHGCEYFVLDVDHDQHAKAALQAYAVACASTHPQLSADLKERYGSHPQATEPAAQTLSDEHLQAAILCREVGFVSVSLVQRKLNTGYNSAQEICQHIINAGLVPGLKIAPSLTTAAAPEQKP